MAKDCTFDQESALYNENINEWLHQHFYKFVVIKNRELVGFFETLPEASAEGHRRFGLGSFMIRQIGTLPGEFVSIRRNPE